MPNLLLIFFNQAVGLAIMIALMFDSLKGAMVSSGSAEASSARRDPDAPLCYFEIRSELMSWAMARKAIFRSLPFEGM